MDHDAAAARDATREVLAYYLHRVEGVVVDTSGADPDQVEAVRRAVREDGVEGGPGLSPATSSTCSRRPATPTR